MRHRCDVGHEFVLPFIHDHCRCPECGELSRYVPQSEPSRTTFRVAVPITLLQDLGKAPDGSHKGYKVLDWIPDSGDSPPPGQPYKTAQEVEREM